MHRGLVALKHTKQNRLNILASPPARRVSGASVSGPCTSGGSTSHGGPSATSNPRASAAMPGELYLEGELEREGIPPSQPHLKTERYKVNM